MSADRQDQGEASGTTKKKAGSNTTFIAIAFPFIILGITQMTGDNRGGGITFLCVGITFLVIGLTSGKDADADEDAEADADKDATGKDEHGRDGD